MDFNAAIKAHSPWKLKLSGYIRNPDKSLDHDHVCKDNQCDLGKWIYGEGGAYSSFPEFSKLKSEHTRFHKAAGEVVRKANNGINVTEDIALGANSEFANASSSVVTAIMELQSKVAKAS